MPGILESKLIWAKGRWERRDYPTIMSGRVVRYNIGYGQPGEVEVSASRDGVHVDGVVLPNISAYGDFMDILRRAWRQHEHLRLAHQNDPLPEEVGNG